MALEQILAHLEQGCEETIAEIRNRAATQIRQIQREKEIRIGEIHREAMEASRHRFLAEANQQRNRARLQAQQVLLAARNDLIDDIFDAAAERLAHTRERPDYPDILAALVREVLAELGPAAELQVDPRDLPALDHLPDLPDQGRALQDADTGWGGVIGQTAGGRITMDNRLQSRFHQARNHYAGRVGNLLEREMGHAG